MFTGHEGVSDEINVSSDGTSLLEDIASLHLSQDFCDITFLVGGERLHAHKGILAARSECFKALFHENSDKNELAILNTVPEAFRLLLKYIYTDSVTIASDTQLTVQVLLLAHKYRLKHLVSGMIRKISTNLDAQKVILFVNEANSTDLDELRDACHSFIDINAIQVLTSDSFSDLSEKSLVQILKRETFVAPEIDIFKSVAKWCEKTNTNLVLECVRLSLLTVSEIVSTVWPTKLVSPEILLQAISEIIGNTTDDLLPRIPTTTMDVNIATAQHGATVIVVSNSQTDTAGLLAGNTDVDKHVAHKIEEGNAIVIRLGRPSSINHIRMMLYDADDRFYSYYIETSLDHVSWHRIIDYRMYACRSVQNLYFDQQGCQYIKVVGTNNIKGSDFHLVCFEAHYKTEMPKVINSVICPEKNVATSEHGAIILKGEKWHSLTDGNCQEFANHRIQKNSEGIIIQLAQPYVISSMQLLLDGQTHCKYNYFIETSVNKTDWEIAVDRRNEKCQSWQDLHFAERVVVFIRITGTDVDSLTEDSFYCDQFECPSEGKK